MSSFASTIFYSRLYISLVIIIGQAYPILLYIGLIYKENKNNYLIMLLLSLCFLLTILILMILGWVLNYKSNIWIKTVVIIASCCAIPHLLLGLVVDPYMLGLPLILFTYYLAYWYLKGGTNYQPKFLCLKNIYKKNTKYQYDNWS